MYLTVLKYLSPVLIFAAYTWAVHDHGVDTERKRWETKSYQSVITAHEAASTFTAGVLTDHQENEKDAQTQIDKQDVNSIAADDASDQLRDEISVYIKRSADSRATFAEYRAAAEARLRVLASMYDLSDRLAGIYADQADRNKIAGDTCVRAYYSLKNQIEQASKK